ncbi:PHB depolymerase family esterase [uncultured Limimaricola sp.]|uniref:extracellular catalytic domain type 1 short-chain-length polyhydroxyalkanoate depolymerase n=1 Tax=uncultured Limimaricola sp. TaxID=2211667 RepID=UPI0030FCCF0D
MSAMMQRAMAALRSQDPMAATREIQAGLSGKGTAAQPAPTDKTATPDARRGKVDILPPDGSQTQRSKPQARPQPRAEDAEILDETPSRRSLLQRLQAHLPGCADCGTASPGTASPLSGLASSGLASSLSGLGTSLPGMARPATEIPLPPGARFERRSHAGPEGGRDYRLYVPSCGAAQVRGLIVMLHGCTQTPEDFASGTGMNAVAEAENLAVAWPEQTRAANMQSCWNWFEAAHQSAAQGEPAILAALTRALCAEFGVGPERCFVAGLSAGGAMAAILGETHPDLFAGIGVHSGLPAGAARDMVSAFSAMRGQGGGRAAAATGPRLFVIHGDADRTVDVSNAHKLMGEARGEAAPATATATGRDARRQLYRDASGRVRAEFWIVAGGGHAWSGGSPSGSYTDPQGPDASREMVRFFLDAE